MKCAKLKKRDLYLQKLIAFLDTEPILCRKMRIE